MKFAPVLLAVVMAAIGDMVDKLAARKACELQ